MQQDTRMGGEGDRFPATRMSAVRAAASPDAGTRQLAHERIVSAYWKPLYKYLRIKWRASNEEAKDLVQGFLGDALEKNWLPQYDPAKARFRTYLRTCADHFVANERKAAKRIKRGGGVRVLSLDFVAAEAEHASHAPPAAMDADSYFEQEYVRHLLTGSIAALRDWCLATGRETQFALFEHYDLRGEEAPVTYADLADAFDLSVTQVTNHLSATRRRFRQLVLEQLQEMSGSDAEYREQARHILGLVV